ATYRFMRGSVELPGDVSRIKLIRDHDPRAAVGKAMEFTDRDDGLWADFYIKRGAAGDEVLSDAEDGVLDGFSVGPKIDSDGWQYESGGSDVRVVSKARLVETTITAFPAFDDARVATVIAERSGAKMGAEDGKGKGDGGQGDGDKATVLDKPDAALERFEADLAKRFTAMADKLAESQETQQAAIAKTVSDAFTAAFERLEDSDASGRGEAAFARLKVVSEPPVYRFGGSHGQPSMVKDAWAYHIDRDLDARDRLRKFQQQQTDLVKFATVTTGNAAEVIPPGYRPDLYVTQLMQGRPIVAQASRGTIADATPFTVPRFVSATGATLDHVEGVNPADGSLDLDVVTVSPGAISGIFKLTREIIDAANPAIDAIAMAAMRESWNRQTEQKAYAELNVNANVGVFRDVSLALLDTDLELNTDQTISPSRDLLARYPFTRFASPSGAVIGQLVTRNFANAKDNTGRPLLPSIGAQNTAGLGNAVQQGWFVDGLPFVPAWAMTQAIGDELALILNRSDWWVWESPLLTFRFEEKSGPAIVELALFGYYATKVLRPAGIFSLRAIA
ncbi:MAG: phage major capsid protein, partial [Gammaproteobacteria bacterium]